MSLEVTALTSYITVVTNQDDTVTVTTQNPSPSQTAILFEDEGAALGTRGTVNEINFTGAGVSATRSGDKITVSVTSGGGGGTWGSITGTLSSQTDLQNELDKKILYLSATGTNTYTAAYSLAAYTTGQTFAVIFANANTGAATLNVNSLGAKSIVKRGSTALIGNDIIANESYILFYDGTNFQLIGRAAPFSDANPIIKNASDYTKQIVLSASGLTTGTTRTLSALDRDGTVADLPNLRLNGATLNRYIATYQTLTSPGATVFTANRRLAAPWVINQKITIDKLLQEIITGTSGKHRFGIYNSTATGIPNNLLFDSGEFTISAPAVLTASPSLTLLPGLYWIVTHSNTANTYRSVGVTSYSPVMGYSSTLGAGLDDGFFQDTAYAALPDPYPTMGASNINSFSFPLTCYRIV